MVQTAPDVEPRSLVKAVESALGERLERELFSVMTQQDLLRMVYRIMGILTALLAGLTAIGLVVGGVGILTVMLMSVNERAKEIGIRKTVGATRRDIFEQFLIEASTLALLGGTVGLGISALVGVVLARLTPIKPLIGPEVILLSFGVSLGVGVVAGLIPAMRAARQDPVVALRKD
ncbi:MAG TPA: FtsX-like permease family protein, partial [Fimbriimonadaceae bacterium]|nr:FtsX-like permease family protein [Fimbriimonadaceae bacterium]